MPLFVAKLYDLPDFGIVRCLSMVTKMNACVPLRGSGGPWDVVCGGHRRGLHLKADLKLIQESLSGDTDTADYNRSKNAPWLIRRLFPLTATILSRQHSVTFGVLLALLLPFGISAVLLHKDLVPRGRFRAWRSLSPAVL